MHYFVRWLVLHFNLTLDTIAWYLYLSMVLFRLNWPVDMSAAEYLDFLLS